MVLIDAKEMSADKIRSMYPIDELTADCCFVFGDNKDEQKRLFCHKSVLAYYSPVFKSMFFGPLKQQQHENKVVKLTDIDQDDFVSVLSFLYLGNLKFKSIETAFKVYYIADKYLLDDLRYLCIKRFLQDIPVDTLFLSYEYATFYGLKTIADNYWQDILIVASDAVRSTYHMKADTLRKLLEQTYINASERDLFERSIAWSKTECLLQNLPETAANQIAIMKQADLLSQFRFDQRGEEWLKKHHANLCELYDFSTCLSGKKGRYTRAMPFRFRRAYKIQRRVRLRAGFNDTIVRANERINVYGIAIAVPFNFWGRVFVYIHSPYDLMFVDSVLLGKNGDAKYYRDPVDEPCLINFDGMITFEVGIEYRIGIYFQTDERVALEMLAYYTDSTFGRSKVFGVESEHVTGLVRGFQFFCS